MKAALCILLTGLPLALTAPAASAADLGVSYAPPPPVPVAVSVVEGWYLRGDIGASVARGGKWHESEFDTPANSDNVYNGFAGTSSKNSANVGLGVGYRFNEWLRTDLTAEYRGATELTGFGRIEEAGGTVYMSKHTGKVDSWLFLANLYADLGTYNHLTPYIGVGVGGSYNRFYDAGQVTLSEAGAGSYGIYADGNKWNWAAALHAGLDYKLSSQLSLDVNYRWLWLGDASTGNLTCYGDGSNGSCSTTGDATTEKWWLKGMQSHDIRVGLRYQFYADAPTPLPVIAKY
jgi:opacity protein-like surface antigen